MCKITTYFTLALLTACSGIPSTRGVSIPGAPPQSIGLELASQVEYKPYPPEVVKNPAVQWLIAQCEQQGGGHCREDTVPANSRTKFVRTQEDTVWAFVSLGGLESERDYAVRLCLFDPEGNMRWRMIFSMHTPRVLPPNFTVTVNYSWSPPDPAAWQLGKWRIEITVNGQVETERTFQVVDQVQ